MLKCYSSSVQLANYSKVRIQFLRSIQAKSELQLWVNNVESSYHKISQDELQSQVTTNTSHKGWGWGSVKRNIHERNMEPVSNKLHQLSRNACHFPRPKNLRQRTKMRQIWEWCRVRDSWINEAHIPVKQNLIEDYEFQRNQSESK